MAISETRVDEFSDLNAEQVRNWLMLATTEFFEENRGALAFTPFELFFNLRDTPALALASGVGQLPVRSKYYVSCALASLVQHLDPAKGEIWLFATELMWRIDAANQWMH